MSFGFVPVAIKSITSSYAFTVLIALAPSKLLLQSNKPSPISEN